MQSKTCQHDWIWTGNDRQICSKCGANRDKER